MQGKLALVANYKGIQFEGEIWCSRNWVNEDGFWKLGTMHVSDARLQTLWKKLLDSSAAIRS